MRCLGFFVKAFAGTLTRFEHFANPCTIARGLPLQQWGCSSFFSAQRWTASTRASNTRDTPLFTRSIVQSQNSFTHVAGVSPVSRPLGSRRSHRVLPEEDSMRCEDLDGSRRVGLDLRAPIPPTGFTRTISKRLRCDTRASAAQDVQREQSKQARILRGRKKTHVEEKARKEAVGDAGQGWETKRA